jgi:glycine/D-amino acid oxidase-like deaminating enzyme
MIIFCEGPAGAANPLFDLLPFSPNKGEALVIESSELNNQHIFKRGHLLVPLPEPGTFWVGANYQWNYEDAGPTEAYRKQITTLLEGWLKVPFRVVDHKAAVRPATIERRPFVGLHPVQPNVAILNGMGSKGTSLAPYFAKELVEHLLHGAPLTPEADVRRFSRILSK